MINKVFRFKPHLSVEQADHETVFLIGEHERFMLRGRLQSLVAPLINGHRTVIEIIEQLGHQATPPEIFYTISNLEQQGYLIEKASPAVPAETAAFWNTLGLDSQMAVRKLSKTPVSIVALGSTPASLAEALAGAGVIVRDSADIQVVLVDDYLAPALTAFAKKAAEEYIRWLPLKSVGTSLWLGPMFYPDRGACWACLKHRLRANRPVESFISRQRSTLDICASPPRALLRASVQAGFNFAALALSRWIIEQDAQASILDHCVLTLDVARLRTQEHMIIKRPQCPVCGDAGLVAKRMCEPVVLAPRLKRSTDDNGYRTVDPEETFSRYQHLISPLTGVIASIGPLPDRNHQLRPVFGAASFVCPAASESLHSAEFNLLTMGKGRTAAQSRTSALCEALERQSVLFHGDEPLKHAPISELESLAVHPNSLLNFSKLQYTMRGHINQSAEDYRRAIPLPFDEDSSIDWLPAWSLTHNERRYLPASLCLRYLPVEQDSRYCLFDSNGHAAGNCLEEAILQGFLELIERDGVGIWWYNRISRPGVELASFNSPYLVQLVEHYSEMNYQLWVLDVTTDIGIPTFVAVAHSSILDRYYMGFGCHLDASLGILRAVTELNQVFQPSSPTHAVWGDYELENDFFLAPNEEEPLRCRNDYPKASRVDLRADIEFCINAVGQFDLDAIVLDQTRPDFGLNVVKVAVPGLRHFWPRFGPGRLYDVPVAMNWRSAPSLECELNPVPLFL